MKIRILRDHENAHGKHRPGDVRDWPRQDALAALAAGLAEPYTDKPRRKGA